MRRKYIYTGFGEALSFAESLGWVEPEDDGRVDWGDAITDRDWETCLPVAV